MKRRDLLKLAGVAGVAAVGASAFPLNWTAAAEGKKKQKILFFTRSAGFEHDAVTRGPNGELGYGERIMKEMVESKGIDIEITKDGAVFDGDLSPYDLIMFFSSGELTETGHKLPPTHHKEDPGQPMSPEGKAKLLAAIKAGKPFYGIHATTDTFRNKPKLDPFLEMVGGEFIKHDAQQVATVKVVAPKFPGTADFDSISVLEEWYTHKNFAPDLHVILVQETEGMEGPSYQRPPYPATWAHLYGKGRVFYTSFGHREDVWQNPKVQEVMLGGVAWTLGNVDADVTPNMEKVCPGANQWIEPAKKSS